MSNLLETLKKIGFEPDFPGNHLVNSDEERRYELALNNVLFLMNEKNTPSDVAIENVIKTFGFNREIDFRQYVLTNPAFMQSE